MVQSPIQSPYGATSYGDTRERQYLEQSQHRGTAQGAVRHAAAVTESPTTTPVAPTDVGVPPPADTVEHVDEPIPAFAYESTLDVPPDSIRGSAAAMQLFTSSAPYQVRVRDLTRELQGTQSRGSAFHAQQQLLDAIQNAIDRVHPNQSQTKSVDLTKVDMGNGKTAAQMLEEAGLAERAGMNDKGQATPASLGRLQHEIQEDQTKLTEGTQTQLIALQEAMHQRDLLVQLATNQLSAQTQTDRQIVGNIR